MDIFVFILELLKIIMWPIITLIVLFTLKSPLSRLICHTQNVKYKDFEIQFKEGVQQLSEDVEVEISNAHEFNIINMIKLADSDPKFAVTSSWQEVYKTSLPIMEKRFPMVDLTVDNKYKVIEDTLIENKIFDEKTGKLFHDLRNLRNKVKHAVKFYIDKGDAVQFIAMCSKLITDIERIEQ